MFHDSADDVRRVIETQFIQSGPDLLPGGVSPGTGQVIIVQPHEHAPQPVCTVQLPSDLLIPYPIVSGQGVFVQSVAVQRILEDIPQYRDGLECGIQSTSGDGLDHATRIADQQAPVTMQGPPASERDLAAVHADDPVGCTDVMQEVHEMMVRGPCRP